MSNVYNFTDDASKLSWSIFAEGHSVDWIIVPTAEGIAVASTYQGDTPKRSSTELRFIYAGLLHTRIIRGKAYNNRYAVTLARRYAAEIVQKGQGGPSQ